jgi:ligand-binding sensor domain-containing protein/signal transduction histidine kinase
MNQGTDKAVPSSSKPLHPAKAGGAAFAVKTRFSAACFLPITPCERVNLNASIHRRTRQWNPLWWSSIIQSILISCHVCALDPARSLYQYNCRSWSRQNGLPANGVYAIRQTKDGYLWLGTSVGLVRFDGSEFKLFDMSQNSKVRSTIITSLSNSKRGGLWFGMERGSFGYCDEKTISLRGRDDYVGMNLDVHSILEVSEGDLWVAAEILAGRVTRTNTFETVLAIAPGTGRYDVTAMYQDSRGRVWLGTARRGVYYWQKNVLTKFHDAVFDGLTVRAFVEDKQGQIWIGTDWGLLCYGSNLQRKPFPYPWHPTRALLVDREGTLWAGTSGAGLVHYLNGTTRYLQETNGLADNFVTALAEDEEGNLWVGTRNGLSQISDVKIPTFGKSDGLAGDIYVAVCASRKGGLWLATDSGFTYFDGVAHSYSAEVGLRNSYVNGVFEASNGDLYLINGAMDIQVFSRGKIVATYPNKTWPTAMAEDSISVIVSIGGELFRVGTNYFVPYVFAQNQKPPLNWIFNMATGKDGAIWIAGDEGICKLKEGKFELWKLWRQKSGVASSKVRWICQDNDGVVWAGLETGLVRLKDGRIRVITQDNGLFDNIINAIVPDDYGNLWADSSRGFFRVSRKSLNDFADRRTKRVVCTGFSGLDAVKSSEKYQQQPSGCKTPDGRIWFPTAQGIVMIDPTNMTANPVPPRVHMQSVRANGRELNSNTQAVLRPGITDLEFHYAGLSFIAPLKIHYRYKLTGYDRDWVDAGARRAAFYTNLKPGKYEFQVQACNEDGLWNTTGARFAVELRPHYYQTAWFYALCGISAGALLGGIYRWRVAQLRRKQLALQQARDLLETKVAERTASLVTEVQQRLKAQTELEGQKATLEKEIEERKRMEIEVERIHRQLLDASRQAGQAEVASSVLHNVGNVLNSVNVSTTVVSDRLRNLQISNLAKAAQLMKEHAADLGPFLCADDKGRKLPHYLEKLAQHLGREQNELLTELKDLADNVEHIKGIVAMQQSYAKVSGLTEKVAVSELVESALKMHSAAYLRHAVNVVREFQDVPPILADRHKVLQILINILQNAKYACAEGGQPDKTVRVRLQRRGQERVSIEIADNGIGIAPENLTRIFSHGFTTRKNGHGFGLHSAALAAREMGGSVTVQSQGLGRGATFTLELPVCPK